VTDSLNSYQYYVYACLCGYVLQEERANKRGGTGMTYLFLIEFDRDHDNKISIEEWNDGFQGQQEQKDE
jgi:hypothetical protein